MNDKFIYNEILNKIVINENYFNFPNSENYKIYQYSNLEICKFLIPLSGEKASLRLNRLDKCNDGQEVNKISEQFNSNPRKFYVACFTKESNENIHMWYMYGRLPYEDKCRYSFNQKALYELIHNNNLKVFYKSENGNIELDKTMYKIEMIKIAYVGHSSEFNERNNYDKIIIGNKKYEFKLEELLNNYNKSLIAGRIKNIAWSSEKEIRILLSLEDENTQIESLYIELNDSIVNKEILISPWNNNIISLNGIDYKESLFKNQLDNIFPKESCRKCR